MISLRNSEQGLIVKSQGALSHEIDFTGSHVDPRSMILLFMWEQRNKTPSLDQIQRLSRELWSMQFASPSGSEYL